jgi:hypothetical protein
MAYRDDIIALGADHLWRFDGDVLDSIGAADGTNTGFLLTSTAICEDATNSSQCNAVSDRVTIPDTATINSALSNKAVGGWVQFDSIQLPPRSIYGEGTTGQQFRFLVWAGNTLMLDIVDGASVYQAFSDQVLQANRAYHIFGIVNGNGDYELYVDGDLQEITAPTDRQFVGATFDSGSPIEFGDPAGATEVGNQTVLLTGSTNCDYNFWASFSDANVPSNVEIRTELFEKGALPDVTITNQAGLDALANSFRPDAPLCIRVDVVGDIELVASNVTFNPRASIDVQYTGTGTLTWVNGNGSDASVFSTPNGGTVNLINPATLSVIELQPNTKVVYYESGTANELASVENSSTQFSATVQEDLVDVVLVSITFEIKRIPAVDLSSGDVTILAGQFFDRNYENP